MGEKLRVVSLFSGAGGLDFGFQQAGFDLVWANDFDKDAVATHRLNVGGMCVHGDIKEIAAGEIPDCDVIVGGFPCQGFSVANAKRNVLDKRNELYKEYVRILRAKRPYVFVAENVRGILTLGKGAVISAIVEEFEACGYVVKYALLNAADYGVPQKRQRVIIVGVRDDLDVEYCFPEPTHSKDGKDGRNVWVSVKEALAGIPDPDGPNANAVPNNEYSKYKVVVKNYTGHRVTNPAEPSPTVLARGNGGGGVCAIPHYNGVRRMTVREQATVQTFPRSFCFVGSRGSCYRQVGNAVPVLLAYKIALSILYVL